MIKLRTFSIALSLIAFTASDVVAQVSPNWDVRAREQAETHHSAAVSLLNAGQKLKAIKLLRQATIADPQDPVPFQTLGLALAMDGKYPEALDSLQRAYTLRPMTETLLSTGIVYYLQHDYDAAINAWSKALQANPKLCQINGDIGMAYLRKGSLREAVDSFQHLAQCSPNSDLAYYGLALTNYFAGDFRTAREQAERALSISDYPPTVMLLAELDMLQGNRARGIKRAHQYDAMVHRHWQQRSMTELGYSAQRDFHWDPYVDDLADNGYLLLARVESDPVHQRSLSSLARAEHVTGGIRSKLASAPGDLWLMHELGSAQMANGDYSGASESFKTVLGQCSLCGVDILNLARSLAMSGKMEQASQYAQEFKKSHPSQDVSSVFTEGPKTDPAIQHEPTAQKRLPVIEKVGPKPVPAAQF
jgi:tetratricopeptide (TPR) repeat protein